MHFYEFVLLQEMSRAEALQILHSREGDSLDVIKKRYRDLALQFHPDRNVGDKDAETEMKKINVAWEVIRSEDPASHSTGVPPWQTDSRSSFNKIRRADFTDLNYCKKTIYEKAIQKGTVRPLSVFAFDGDFLRGTFIVFGNDKVFSLIGKAMETWNNVHYGTQAVLVTERSGHSAKIIRIDGRNSNIDIEFNSFNLNPGNDPTFLPRLKEVIWQYRAKKQ